MEDLPEIFIPNLKVTSKTIVGKRDFTSGMILVILVTGLYILASLFFYEKVGAAFAWSY